MKVECKELPGQLNSRVEDIEIIIIWMLLVVQYLYFSLELYYKVLFGNMSLSSFQSSRKGKWQNHNFSMAVLLPP